MTARADPFYASLGARMRDQRKSKGITQEELAQSLGLNRTSVVNIEKGRQRIAVHQLVQIADHLGCDAATLIPPTEEDSLLNENQRNRVTDDTALGFIEGVAAEARRSQ